MTFANIEAYRQQYREKMPIRDELTAVQQIALVTIRNQVINGGSAAAILVLMSKPTVRALWDKGLIDSRGHLTKTADQLVRSWWDEAKRTRA